MEIFPVEVDKWRIVNQLYTDITLNLRNNGIHQWDRYYPNRFVIKGDLKHGNLFGMHEDKQLVGAIVLDTKESKKYQDLNWTDIKGEPLVIHRLGVHPVYQGKGYGKRLLEFAEEFAVTNGHSSIRLDVYSGNPGAVVLYERKGYRRVGGISFPFRSVPYYCFEKNLKHHIF
ncbi:MAG TPA: GNAT family N-acetyltransferase [Neobacillus sp.]|jgi:GNAT superfamily N-acetyltransferase